MLLYSTSLQQASVKEHEADWAVVAAVDRTSVLGKWAVLYCEVRVLVEMVPAMDFQKSVLENCVALVLL